MADMSAILQALQSGDTNQIKQGEAAFEAVKAQPDVLLAGLIGALQAPTADAGTKQLAAVLLRKVIERKGSGDLDVYGALAPDTAAQLRGVLLQLVAVEGQPKLQRNALSSATSALGSRLIDTNGWPELLPWLANALQTATPDVQCSALAILSTLLACNADAGLRPHIPAAAGMLGAALGNGSAEVRIAAADAALGAVQQLELELCAPMFPLVAPVMQAVSGALQAGSSEPAREVIAKLCQVAESNPAFFTSSGAVTNVFEAMLSVASTDSFSDEVRQAAVEFLVSFAESESRATKKVPQFVERIVPMMMLWTTTVEDDPKWGHSEEDDEADDDGLFKIGEESLDRLAIALGGKIFARTVMNEATRYLREHSGDWRYRRSALLAMSQCAEGCKKQFAEALAGMVQKTLEAFADPHPRVRWTAVQSIALFSSEFAPDFQTMFKDHVLPAIMQLLQDPVPRIKHHAAAAVCNFVSDIDEDCYSHHVEPLLLALYKLMEKQDEPMWVKERALDAVSAIAEDAGKTFAAFYDHFMPVMKCIIALPEVRENRMVKAKTLVAAAYMAVAAGKDRFAADGEVIMGYMHSLSQQNLEADDPRPQYLLKAWVKLAECIGEQFAPYLDAVLPYVLRLAGNKDCATILEADEEPPEEEGLQCIRLAVKGAGNKQLAIRTTVLQEKEAALEILVEYFKHLQHVMAPWVERIAGVVVPQLTEVYADGIRAAAAQCVPGMVRSLRVAADKGQIPPEPARQLLLMVVPEMIKALRAEPDVDTAAKATAALKDAIDACGEECLPAETVLAVMATVKELFEESLKRRAQLTAASKQGDEDEQDQINEETEAEEELLTASVDVVGVFVKTHPVAFMQTFIKEFLPSFTQMLTAPQFGELEQKLALFVLVDFVDHGKDHAAPFFGDICSALLQFASKQDPGIAQACAYGLGICSDWAAAAPGRALPPGAAIQATQVLKQMCAAAPKDDDDWDATLANAASSLLKLLRTCQGQDGITQEAVLPAIFPLLPVHGDEAEAQSVHKYVFDLVEAQHPVVIGAGGANLQAIAGVAQKLLALEIKAEEKLVDENTRRCVTKIAGGVVQVP